MAEIRLESAELTPVEKPVMTRPELPDIRQPLEILSDEIAPKEPEPAPRVDAVASAAERAAARKVFEAKFKEPNPRLPFYIVMGLLGVFAVGTAGYFWYQLRPPPPLVSANPSPRAAEQVAAPDPKPAAPLGAAAGPVASLTAIPGLPTSAPSAAPAASRCGAQAGTRSDSRAQADARTAGPGAQGGHAASGRRTAGTDAAAAASAPEGRIRRTRRTSPATSPVRAPITRRRCATRAATAMRFSESRRSTCAPGASSRRKRSTCACCRPIRSDAHAQAALIALRASRLDPLATESRVKTMLAADPDAEALHFTLGNQLAQQGRWAEAQAAYFKAFAADPENADFAFNLAVSLDHLRQSKPALDYYRRAIALAEKRSASFDVAAARNRVAQLAN